MKIVLPGDVIGKGKVKLEEKGTAIEQSDIKYATVVGIKEEDRFIPLEYVYIPKLGDNIVGIVTDERSMGYIVDTNTHYKGIILSRETRNAFPVSSQIYAKISRIEGSENIILSDAKKLYDGKLIRVPSSKVPRVIGKAASMINTIKEKTGTNIYVGSNGYIWIGKEGDVEKAVIALTTIIEKAHLKGLTDEISKILEKKVD